MIIYNISVNQHGNAEYNSNIIFTSGDTGAYGFRIVLTDESLKNCWVIVKAKRADGTTVIGEKKPVSEVYEIPNNMYSAQGDVSFEIALTDSENVYITMKVVYAQVREGFGDEGIEADDRYPVLMQLINEVQSTVALEEKIDLKADKTMVESTIASLKTGSEQGVGTLEVSDNIAGLPLKKISVLGTTFQDEVPRIGSPKPIIPLENPTVTVNGISVTLPYTLYGGTSAEDFIDKIYTENGKVYYSKKSKYLRMLSSLSWIYIAPKSRLSANNTVSFYAQIKAEIGTPPKVYMHYCTHFENNVYYTADKRGFDLYSGQSDKHGFLRICVNITYPELEQAVGAEEGSYNSSTEGSVLLQAFKKYLTQNEVYYLYGYDNEEEIAEITSKEASVLLDMLRQPATEVSAECSSKNGRAGGIEIKYSQTLDKVISNIENAIVALGGSI